MAVYRILAYARLLAARSEVVRAYNLIKSLVDQSVINDQTQATKLSVQQITLDDIFPSSDKAGKHQLMSYWDVLRWP